MNIRLILAALALANPLLDTPAASVKIWPAPAGEPLSREFRVTVEGREAPVYLAKVAPADPARRWKAMDDKANSAQYYEWAAFSLFEMSGPVEVTVICTQEIASVRVLPSSLKLKPVVRGRTLSLVLAEAKPVTVEINGNWVGALHLFASPPEKGAPHPEDPNVIYYGPGVHEVSRRVVRSGQTVYVAGGAVVRGVVKPDERYSVSAYSGLRNYAPTFELRGTNIAFRGRGIVDGGQCPTHARNLLYVQGTNITIDGVVLRDSSTWTIPVRRSEDVTVRNARLIGYRANSDGIDICNSRRVRVEDCFIRTLDDLIVIKTDAGAGRVEDISATRCVLWNEVAHALSVGAELREDVRGVRFTDCDVIHDKGREWTLRVYHCDSARISDVLFENLRIEESPRLVSLWIGTAVWTRDTQRGHIADVVFRDIHANANPLRVELQGFDPEHAVDGVLFSNVVVNGRPLRSADVKTNAFVRNVTVTP